METSPKKTSSDLERRKHVSASPQRQQRSTEASVHDLAKLTETSPHGKRRLHDLAKLTETNRHGKRRINGDDVHSKRRRIQHVDAPPPPPRTSKQMATRTTTTGKDTETTQAEGPDHEPRARADVNYNLKELSQKAHSTGEFRPESLVAKIMRKRSKELRKSSKEKQRARKRAKSEASKTSTRHGKAPPKASDNDPWETDDSEYTAHFLDNEVVTYLAPILRKGGVRSPSEALRYLKYTQFAGLPKRRDLVCLPGSSWALSSVRNRRADIAALLLYITGVAAPTCCKFRCQNNLGPFVGCIMPADLTMPMTYYGCANCVYRGLQSMCARDRRHRPNDLVAIVEPPTSTQTTNAKVGTKKQKPAAALASSACTSKATVQPGSAAIKDKPRSKEAVSLLGNQEPGKSTGRVTESKPGSSSREEHRQMANAATLSGQPAASSQVKGPGQTANTAATTETGLSRLTRSRLQIQREESSKPAPAVAEMRASSQAQEQQPVQPQVAIVVTKEWPPPTREMLTMEQWERAPGRLRSQASENPESKCFLLPSSLQRRTEPLTNTA